MSAASANGSGVSAARNLALAHLQRGTEQGDPRWATAQQALAAAHEQLKTAHELLSELGAVEAVVTLTRLQVDTDAALQALHGVMRDRVSVGGKVADSLPDVWVELAINERSGHASARIDIA